MISFHPRPGDSPVRILLVGAHSDDIEIGCGGTIRRMLASYPDASVMWVVLSGAGEREAEARTSARKWLSHEGEVRFEVCSFSDGRFPFEAAAIKTYFEEDLKPFRPDLILSHYGEDRHQDHRVVSDMVWQTFRNHMVLEYEVAKYDADLGRPNVYVALDIAEVDFKVTHILDCFQTQRSRQWFDEATFRGLMRIRGLECVAESGYAEAFHGRKVRLL